MAGAAPPGAGGERPAAGGFVMAGVHNHGGCNMVLLVQAEFDGELDAAQAAQLAAHQADCALCQAAAADLARSRELIRPELYEPAPDDLRARVLARLDLAGSRPEPQPPSSRRRVFAGWRPPAFGFGLGAACATVLALLMLSPAEQQGLTDQIVAGHIRALQPGHLEDVPSSDQHTV